MTGSGQTERTYLPKIGCLDSQSPTCGIPRETERHARDEIHEGEHLQIIAECHSPDSEDQELIILQNELLYRPLSFSLFFLAGPPPSLPSLPPPSSLSLSLSLSPFLRAKRRRKKKKERNDDTCIADDVISQHRGELLTRLPAKSVAKKKDGPVDR